MSGRGKSPLWRSRRMGFVRDGIKRQCFVVELKDGDQFDTKMGFDHESIVKERKADAAENRRFLVQALLQIPSIDQIMRESR